MRLRLVSTGAAALLLAAGVLLAAPAQAAFNPNACNTGPNYTDAFSGSYSGSVTVPSGATCNLQGATIGGSVTVQPGGTLISGGGTTIGGSVTATNPGTVTANPFATGNESFSVIICNSKVGGSVSVSGAQDEVLVGGTSSTGGGCGGNNIGGNATFSGNHATIVILAENAPGCPIGSCHVGGSVTATNNGSFSVLDNLITGSLNCSGNAWIGGSGNTAARKTGQCSTF